MWHRSFFSSALCSLMAALSGCGGGDGQAAPGPPQMPPAEVTVALAQVGDAAITHELNGRVLAFRGAEVRARVEGILEKRLFAEGTEVKEGQPLFRIDARTLQAALDSARANAEVARQTVARYRQLVAGEAISKQEVDQAEAALKQAEAALTRAQIDFEHAHVRAPISGRIGRAFVTEGALVGRGEATPLATIEQLEPIYVDFAQSGAEMLRLRKAVLAGEMKNTQLPVELTLEDGSRYSHTGKLLFAEQTVDPSTGTVSLRAQFPNPQRLLLPGMFATVRVSVGAIKNAVKVPQRAVQASPQGQFVYLVDAENKVVSQPVETAGFSGPQWIVTAGLKGGERVVVDGVQKIRPGAVVNPAVADAAQAPSQPPSQAPAPAEPAGTRAAPSPPPAGAAPAAERASPSAK
jgi:membrane fusion protein, multidrug efflux system